MSRTGLSELIPCHRHLGLVFPILFQSDSGHNSTVLFIADHDFMSHCRPEYRFQRLDNPAAKIAPGWNFRHADYFSNNNRTLFKSYGILFVVDVQGQAGKFNLIPFFLNVGAGLALLGITTVLCDIIVLYFMREGNFYYEKKYLLVKGRDAFSVDRRTEDDEEGLLIEDHVENSSPTNSAQTTG